MPPSGDKMDIDPPRTEHKSRPPSFRVSFGLNSIFVVFLSLLSFFLSFFAHCFVCSLLCLLIALFAHCCHLQKMFILLRSQARNATRNTRHRTPSDDDNRMDVYGRKWTDSRPHLLPPTTHLSSPGWPLPIRVSLVPTLSFFPSFLVAFLCFLVC